MKSLKMAESEKHLCLSGLFEERHFSSIYILFLYLQLFVSICEFADIVFEVAEIVALFVFFISVIW